MADLAELSLIYDTSVTAFITGQRPFALYTRACLHLTLSGDRMTGCRAVAYLYVSAKGCLFHNRPYDRVSYPAVLKYPRLRGIDGCRSSLYTYREEGRGGIGD